MAWYNVVEASSPGPANPGILTLPDSQRQKTGPEAHVPVKFKPDGEVGHVRRSTITPPPPQRLHRPNKLPVAGYRARLN